MANGTRCAYCRKVISDQRFRKVEQLSSGQGTHRNFRVQAYFVHEACWQEEKIIMDRQDAERAAVREREIAEARRSLLARGRWGV
jgi:hypothetical protein